MILAIDTDVLVNWMMDGAPHHRGARRLLERELALEGGRLGVTPQVMFEFLHVCTDARRFEKPLSMEQAGQLARQFWDASEVERLLPGPTVLHRTLDLLKSLRLGRKRILDTALAATLEASGVRRLATLNARDFEVFSFLELVSPD